MTTQAFRFAVYAAPEDGEQWLAVARRTEELGYSTLFMPDGLRLPSPFPALGLAAGATASLRVGTFVLASPLRPPRLAAWEAHSLSMLSGGRFEFGIGTGRPDVADDAVRLLGRPPATVGQRLEQVTQTISELRQLDGDRHTPVMIAASGPKARAAAAAAADIVALAGGPFTTREEHAGHIAEISAAAGQRADQLEFAAPLFVVGDEPSPFALRFLQTDMATLVARDSLMILRGSVREMADEMRRRRDATGISYIIVNGFCMDAFAPVLELLAGS